MGIFDQNLNFEDQFNVGDRFVLTSLRYEGTISTRHGQAERVTVGTVTRDSYPKVVKYSALGVGFANMAKQAERGDFPVVVEYILVDLPGDKTLKRFAKVDVTPTDWKNGEDGPPVDVEQYTPKGVGDTSTAADSDIPF